MRRITGELLESMRTTIAPLDTPERRDRYRRRDIPRGHLAQDLDKRYRFDLYAMAGGYRLHRDEDLSDAHIYTALRTIIPPL